MLLFFRYNSFLKRKTAITVFFGSYRKGIYRTLNNESGTILCGNSPENPYPHLNLMNVTTTIFLI
jgi:hypothetical protein